jgi:hypothetical protein
MVAPSCLVASSCRARSCGRRLSDKGPARGTWRKQLLPRSQFPKFLYEGEAVPERGWAIEAFSQVFKDGKAAGLFTGMTIDREGKSILSYEFIGEGPSTGDLLK